MYILTTTPANTITTITTTTSATKAINTIAAAKPNTVAILSYNSKRQPYTIYYAIGTGVKGPHYNTIKQLDGHKAYNALFYLGQHFIVRDCNNGYVGLYHTHRAALKAAKGAIVASGNGATVRHHYACGNELTITYGIFNGKLDRYNIA